MKDPVSKYFRIGLVAGMAYAPALKELGWAEITRRIAADDFFDVIEVNPLPDNESREAVRTVAGMGHLLLCQNAHGRLMAAGLNPNDPDEAGRMKAEAALIDGVDEAASLGISAMGMLAGKWTPETRETCFGQLKKTVLNVCRCAQAKGITVELEVFDHDIAKKALLGPATLAARFAAEVRAEVNNFGLMVDLSHIPMTYETPAQVIPVLKPYITHLHMGNTVIFDPQAPAYGDEHPRFGFPGSENDVPQLTDFLRELRKNGFFDAEKPCTLTFEIKPWTDEDIDIVIANAKRTLNRAWALLED